MPDAFDYSDSIKRMISKLLIMTLLATVRGAVGLLDGCDGYSSRDAMEYGKKLARSIFRANIAEDAVRAQIRHARYFGGPVASRGTLAALIRRAGVKFGMYILDSTFAFPEKLLPEIEACCAHALYGAHIIVTLSARSTRRNYKVPNKINTLMAMIKKQGKRAAVTRCVRYHPQPRAGTNKAPDMFVVFIQLDTLQTRKHTDETAYMDNGELKLKPYQA